VTHTATQQDSPSENHLIVEDVVSAITGAVGNGGAEELRFQMERAAAEFDKRTANAFGRALLDSLCEDPGNLRQLEALLILGLAHPDVLEHHRISLAVEGRRLAVLLERSGEPERARIVLELLSRNMPEERTIDHELAGLMRRAGHTDELVERYLHRAEQAVEDGRVGEAIPWLQEILLLDRTRRDVARMIRDLRYQDAERAAQRSRRTRVMLIVFLLSAVLTAVVAREVRLHREFAALPAVDADDAQSLYARYQAIDAFIHDHRVWAGLIGATGERGELRRRINEHELSANEREVAENADAQQNREMADASRMRGLMNSEQGDFAAALEDFQRALQYADADWPHRQEVERDVEALKKWQAEQGR